MVSGPAHSIKVPDAWERRFTAFPAKVVPVMLVFIALACAALVLFIKRLGQGSMRTSVYVRLAVVAGLAASLVRALDWPTWAADYDTAVPWSNAVSQQVALIVGFGAIGLGIGLLVLIADTLLVRQYGAVPFLPARSGGRAACLRDALVGGLAGGLILLGVGQLTDFAQATIPMPRSAPGAGLIVGSAFGTLWPAASAWLGAAVSTLTQVSALAVAAALALTWLRTRTRILLVAGLLAAGMAFMIAETFLGFVVDLALVGSSFASLAWLVWYLRRNATGYLIACGVTATVPSIVELGQHPAYRLDALVYTMILVGIAGGLALWWRREVKREAAVPSVGAPPSVPV